MDDIENRDLYSHIYHKITSECAEILGCRFHEVINVGHHMSPIYNSNDFFKHTINSKDYKISALGPKKYIFKHKATDLKIVYYHHYFGPINISGYFIKRSEWVKAFRALVKVRKDKRRKIYLNDGVKDKIDEFINSYKKFKTGNFGIKINRGLLLSGHPGNGKTYVGRAIFDSIDNPDGYSFFTEFTLIKHICDDGNILDCLIDDISSNVLNRTDPNSSALLSKLDSGGGSISKLRIFTTNESIENIDRAFLRPGRIDTVIAVESPNKKTREKIFANWKSNIKFDIDKIVDCTEGSTYAELNMYKIYMVDSFHKNGSIDTEEIINKSRKAISIEQNKQMGFR